MGERASTRVLTYQSNIRAALDERAESQRLAQRPIHVPGFEHGAALGELTL